MKLKEIFPSHYKSIYFGLMMIKQFQMSPMITESVEIGSKVFNLFKTIRETMKNLYLSHSSPILIA